MPRASIASLGLFLGACNCADPAIRPDAGASVVEADAAAVDAPMNVGDARVSLDAARAPDDLGPPRVRDAYVPRELPPDPPEGACEETASMRLLDRNVDRTDGRGALFSVRWGEGLLLQWSESAAGGLTRIRVGRVAEPVAGPFEPLRSSFGARVGAWLPTADGGIRFVEPGISTDLDDDGFGAEVPLPLPPAGFDSPSPNVACSGAEGVGVWGRHDDEDAVSLLEWIDGAPRWGAWTRTPPDARDMRCVATEDGISIVWTTGTAHVVVAQQWDARGDVYPEPVVWTIDDDHEHREVVAVQGREDADAPLLVAASSRFPDSEIAFTLGRLTLGAVETIGTARVERAGESIFHMYGAAMIGGRVVIVFVGSAVTTITVDPDTGVFGPPTIVAGHSCGAWGNGVWLPTGLYVGLECNGSETWLLRVCGDAT